MAVLVSIVLLCKRKKNETILNTSLPGSEKICSEEGELIYPWLGNRHQPKTLGNIGFHQINKNCNIGT